MTLLDPRLHEILFLQGHCEVFTGAAATLEHSAGMGFPVTGVCGLSGFEAGRYMMGKKTGDQ
jgi:hypothetical protein